MSIIGSFVEHNFSGNRTGMQIVDANEKLQAIFHKGAVVIISEKGQYQGLCESLESAVQQTELYKNSPYMHFSPRSKEADSFRVTMPIQDAIQVAEMSGGNLWLRPVTWNNSGTALLIDNGCFMTIPTPRGGTPAYMPRASDMSAEWEVISPTRVLDEKEQAMEQFA